MPEDLEGAARQLEFLRGLFQGGRMDQSAAADLASEQALEVLRCFAAEMEQLRSEVSALRREVEMLRAELDSAGAAVDDEGRIACPDCGQRLAVGADIASGKAIEVTCPSCNALLEVS